MRLTRSGCAGGRRRRVSFAGPAAKSARRSSRPMMQSTRQFSRSISPVSTTLACDGHFKPQSSPSKARPPPRRRSREICGQVCGSDRTLARVPSAGLQRQIGPIVRPGRGRGHASPAISGRGRACNAAPAGTASPDLPALPPGIRDGGPCLQDRGGEAGRRCRALFTHLNSPMPRQSKDRGSEFDARDLPLAAYEFERSTVPAI